jgi:hypothetical protein
MVNRKPTSRERVFHILFAVSGVCASTFGAYGPSGLPSTIAWLAGILILAAWLTYTLRHTSLD